MWKAEIDWQKSENSKQKVEIDRQNLEIYRLYKRQEVLQ
jgi:hypothetical protein